MILSNSRFTRMLMAGLLLAGGTVTFATGEQLSPAKNPVPASAKGKKRNKRARASTRMEGGRPGAAVAAPDYSNTITTHTNALGQTIYSIQNYHHDVSPPFSEMARNAAPLPPPHLGEGRDDFEDPVWSHHR